MESRKQFYDENSHEFDLAQNNGGSDAHFLEMSYSENGMNVVSPEHSDSDSDDHPEENEENDDKEITLFKKFEVMRNPANILTIISAHQIERDQYKRKLKEAEKEIDLLNDAKMKMEINMVKIQTDNRTIMDALIKCENVIGQMVESYNNLVDDFNAFSKQSKELHVKYECLNEVLEESKMNSSQLDDLKAQFDAMEKSHDELQQKCDNLTSERAVLMEEMKNIENNNEELLEKLRESEEGAKNTENTLQEKIRVIESMTVKEEQVKTYVNQLREEIIKMGNDNEAKVQALEGELSRKNEEAQQNRFRYQNDMKEMYDELASVQQILNNAAIQSKSQEDAINSLNQKVTDLQKENENLATANTDLLLRVRENDNNAVLEIKKLKETHKDQVASLNTEIQNLRQQLFDQQHREVAHQRRLKELENEQQSNLAYIESLEKRQQQLIAHQKTSTPCHTNAPPASIALSPISDGRDAKPSSPKKMKSNDGLAIPVATVPAQQNRRFFKGKTPGEKYGFTGAVRNSQTNQRPAKKQNKVPMIDLDSSGPESSNHQARGNRSDFDIFSLTAYENNCNDSDSSK